MQYYIANLDSRWTEDKSFTKYFNTFNQNNSNYLYNILNINTYVGFLVSLHTPSISYMDVYSNYHLISRISNSQPTNSYLNYYSTYVPTHSTLQKLFYRGAAIWLNAKGDISYRLSSYGEIHTTTPEKASRVLSNFFHQNIRIVKHYKFTNGTEKILKKDINDDLIIILINDLLLVENENFNIYSQNEFFKTSDGLIYRNTYRPSPFLQKNLPINYQFHHSTILQYLYYLSNYKPIRIEWMLRWLASFFQNFDSKSSIPLVLIGGNKSGIDILFEEIIKPLFGQEYCIKITDDHLQLDNFPSSLQNKLFYNFDNISTNTGNNIKSNRLLSNLIVKQKLLIRENKNTIRETDIFGQTLITIDSSYIPYLDNSYNSYIVFKVPDNLEKDLFLPEWSRVQHTAPFVIKDFIDAIKNDLTNFSYILKGYQINSDPSVFLQDDKSLIHMSPNDKLKTFCKAIATMDTDYFTKIQSSNPMLYEEIKQDFLAKRIKQRNIFKCFECIYNEEKQLSSKILMHKLRQIDTHFFRTDGIRIGAGGIKYFHYN